MPLFMRFTYTKAGTLRITRLGVIIFFLLLIGCSPYAANKKITPLVTADETYSLMAGGIKSQNRWWDSLNDPVLGSLIKEALSAIALKPGDELILSRLQSPLPGVKVKARSRGKEEEDKGRTP